MKKKRITYIDRNTQTYTILFSILKRCVIAINTEPLLLNECEWSDVYAESKQQGVCSLTYSLLLKREKENMPSNILCAWKTCTINTYLRNQKLIDVQNIIVNALEYNRVKYAIVKGFSNLFYYNDDSGLYRHQNDIDVIIDSEKFAYVKNIMDTICISPLYYDDIRMKYCLDGISIEIETNRFSITMNDVCNLGGIKVSKRCECIKEFAVMPIELQLIFAIRHMRNHILESSIGIRHIMDFAVVYKVVKNQGKLKDIGNLLDNKDKVLFSALSIIINYNVFETCEHYDSKTQQLLYDILDGGEFGCKSKYRGLANTFIRTYRCPQLIIRTYVAMSMYVGTIEDNSRSNKVSKYFLLLHRSIKRYRSSEPKDRAHLINEIMSVRSRKIMYKQFGLI